MRPRSRVALIAAPLLHTPRTCRSHHQPSDLGTGCGPSWACGIGRTEARWLVVFSTCVDFIRTVPFLQHDPDRPEDVMTDSEDHGG
jgi:hypothetical protein